MISPKSQKENKTRLQTLGQSAINSNSNSMSTNNRVNDAQKNYTDYQEVDSSLIMREVHQTFHNTVFLTDENFVKINIRLGNDDPTISALKLEVALTKLQLETLFQSIQKNTELGHIIWHKDQISCQALRGIETKLSDNNKNCQHYPNDYVHVLLSMHAYADSKEGDPAKLEEIAMDHHLESWKVEKICDDTDKTGYYGMIYKNDKTHQIVLAHRGPKGGAKEVFTNLLNKNDDWKTYLEEILGGQIIVGQQARNYEFTEEAIKLAKKLGYRLSFTGHSLGAWLAELSAFYSHAYFDYRNVKAVTFESPGTLPMLEKLQSNIQSRQTQVNIDDIEIVTYLASPNPVNCCNKHMGRVYTMKVGMAYTDWAKNALPNWIPKWISDWINDNVGSTIKGALALEGHTLIGILAMFDSKTGKPKSCQRVIDWPRVEYQGAAKEFSQQGFDFIAGGLSKPVELLLDFFRMPKQVSKPLEMIASKTIDCLIGDTTLMTIIGFIKSFIEGDIAQNQYWAYFNNIDWEKEEKGTLKERKELFDNRFTLAAHAKYRLGDDAYDMDLQRGSVDEYLYKIYNAKEKLKEIKTSSIKSQLEELLASFDIHSIGDGKYRLVPKNGYDFESIRGYASRLSAVLPKDALKSASGIEKVVTKKLIFSDNLPLSNPYYLKRKESIELDMRLDREDVIVISGAGGTGKSTLAAEYGRACKENDCWQVRWITGTQIEEEFLKLGQEMGIETVNLRSEDLRNKVYKYLEELGPRQVVLLIFDKVENREKIEKYLSNLPNNTKIIITARNGQLLKGREPIEMYGFNKGEGIAYLKKALKRKVDEKEAEEIVKIVGESPFRLSKAVAYLNDHSLQSVDAFIANYTNIKTGETHNAEIYSEVELLFGNIKEDSAGSWKLLKYLAFLDVEGVPLDFIIKVMGGTREELEKHINELKELSLLNVVHEGTKIILKVSHSFIQDETKKAVALEDRNKAEEIKILTNLIDTLNQKLPLLDEKNFHLANWEELAALVMHSKKVIQGTDLLIEGRGDLLKKIGSYFFHVVSDDEEAIRYWEKELNLRESIKEGNHLDVANSLNNIGLAYHHMGGKENTQTSLEYLNQAYDMFKDLSKGQPHLDMANCLSYIGLAYCTLEDKENCYKYLIEAYQIYLTLSLGIT